MLLHVVGYWKSQHYFWRLNGGLAELNVLSYGISPHLSEVVNHAHMV